MLLTFFLVIRDYFSKKLSSFLGSKSNETVRYVRTKVCTFIIVSQFGKTFYS